MNNFAAANPTYFLFIVLFGMFCLTFCWLCIFIRNCLSIEKQPSLLEQIASHPWAACGVGILILACLEYLTK